VSRITFCISTKITRSVKLLDQAHAKITRSVKSMDQAHAKITRSVKSLDQAHAKNIFASMATSILFARIEVAQITQCLVRMSQTKHAITSWMDYFFKV